MKRNTPKVLIWDLETGGVNAFYADLGFILNFGYKWLGEETTRVLKVSDYKGWWSKQKGVDDRKLVQHALRIMARADLLVAHFGDKFDRRFFQGRCAIHDLKPPPPTKQRDTWRIARTAFAFRSNRLGALAKSLNLPQQKHQKTANEWPGWWVRAMAGNEKSVNDMAKYCAQDVRTLEQVYLRIRQYDNPHPRLINNRNSCRLCGGSVTYKGYERLRDYKYKRFQCKECGRWDRERKAVKE